MYLKSNGPRWVTLRSDLAPNGKRSRVQEIAIGKPWSWGDVIVRRIRPQKTNPQFVKTTKREYLMTPSSRRRMMVLLMNVVEEEYRV